jgi:segregation and condensation protein B
MEQKKGMIEGILFSMGGSVKKRQLMEVLEINNRVLSDLLEQMKEEYRQENRGIELIELDDACQLRTKSQYYTPLINIVKQPKKHRLTDAMLETLSIIAYKQPVTKHEIESIRGVKCDYAINRLIEYNLICEAGRLNTIGRPILFQTTEEFLRSFGVEHMSDLPSLDPSLLEECKKDEMEKAEMILNPEEEEES